MMTFARNSIFSSKCNLCYPYQVIHVPFRRVLCIVAFDPYDIDMHSDKDSDPLFPVKLNGKWGYINFDGNMVIEPKFEYAEFFHEGFAVVRSRSGNAILEKRNKGFRDSFTGKLKWHTTHQDYGYIDKSGEFLVEPRYDYADAFSEGRATVRIGDRHSGIYGYIDKSGSEVIKPQYPYLGFTKNDLNFSDGLAPVKIDRKIAYINYSGHVEFQTDFDHAWAFSEGLAKVRKGTMEKGKYGYIDKKGNVVIDLKFILAHSFSEGLAGAMIEDWTRGLFGFINKSGEFQIPRKYRRVGMFNNDFAWAWKGDRINAFLALLSRVPFEPYISGTSEFIDKNGHIRLSIRGGWVGYFDGEYSLRELGGRSSFIDKSGKECFNKTFNRARPFHNDLAMVQVDGKWGYINRNGEYVWDPSE